MSRVAAIDCGTNSIRLLIADASANGAPGPLTDVVREMRVVRLGQGVDATGAFGKLGHQLPYLFCKGQGHWVT